MTQRYITTWRKPGQLGWEHWVSDDMDELKKVLENIKKQGVKQYHTYPIGNLMTEMSSEY